MTDLDGGEIHPIEEPPVRRSRAPMIIGIVVVVALVGAGVAFAVLRGDDGPSHPDKWDPRVADLASFVGRERGHAFKHPIAVEFLSDADFRKKVTAHDELTPEDKEELDQLSGVVRALGLAEGKLDLLAAFEQIQGETVIGLYSPETESITIRGDKVLPTMRPTLVHELTHALQDQLYDLEPDTETSGESFAFRVLIESDALRIEHAYTESLSDAEQAAAEKSDQDASDDVDLEGVPEFLTELFATPYVLGPPWLEAIMADGGNDAVDKAFARLPVTEEQIVEPSAYLTNDAPQKVATPKVGDGDKVLDSDDFGMLSLLLVLGERLSYDEAWAAVDGWEGDAQATYRHDGRTCIRVDVRTDGSNDRDELLTALEDWSQGSPELSAGKPSATVTRKGGGLVELTSCDPGTAATRPAAAGPRAFEILTIQRQLIGLLRKGGVDAAVAECAAVRLTAGDGAQNLHDVNLIQDPNDPRVAAFGQRLRQDVAACMSQG